MKAFALLLLAIAQPDASLADRQLADPRQEAAARALMAEIRCVQCQGQAVGDSDAPIAGSMRAEIRTRIRAGEKPDEIRTWLIQRYGDWVSYDPPLDARTWPLWAAPIVILLAAATLAVRRFRRRA